MIEKYLDIKTEVGTNSSWIFNIDDHKFVVPVTFDSHRDALAFVQALEATQ